MEKKKNKKLYKVFCVISVVAILCSLFVLPSYAIGSFNTDLKYSENPVCYTLGVGTTVAAGQYFQIPDLFSCSSAGSSSAMIVQKSNNYTFNNMSYVADLHNRTHTWNGFSYNSDIQVYCPNSSLNYTGCTVAYNMQIDEDTETVVGFEPLLSMEDVIYSPSSNMAIFQYNSNNTYVTEYWAFVTMLGYTNDGEAVVVPTHFKVSRSSASVLQFDLATIVQNAVAQANASGVYYTFNFGGYYNIYSLKIYQQVPNEDPSTFYIIPLSNIICFTEVYNEGNSRRSQLHSEYMSKFSLWAYNQGAASDSAKFVNSSWFSWIGTTIGGILDVKIFGDSVNFTLGGMLGSVIALSFVVMICKVFRG